MASATMRSLLASLLFVCFISLGQSRDYSIEVNEKEATNTFFVEKDSAYSHYTGGVSYQGTGNETCSWVFCVTRNFRGVVMDLSDDGTPEGERIMTNTEGCLMINDGNFTTDEEGTTSHYGGSVPIDPFGWNAEGEFYLNGQLLSGDCTAILTVTGFECENEGEFGFGCNETDDFGAPGGDVELTPDTALVFVALNKTFEGENLGQLKVVIGVVDTDSDGAPVGALGTVRLLLDGIPTDDDYDYQAPLAAPSTELSIDAARRDSNYFYAVQATENVTVDVETISVRNCGDDAVEYGPNCSITAQELGPDKIGEALTFDPATDANCYTGICYFFLPQKNIEVTVTTPASTDSLAVFYKTNNFPTSTDYDVVTPSFTTFIPDFFETEATAQLAVYVDTGVDSFTILLGEGVPQDDDDDDGAPWAWIGVSIALGVVIIVMIIGGVVYCVREPRTYVTVQ